MFFMGVLPFSLLQVCLKNMRWQDFLTRSVFMMAALSR